MSRADLRGLEDGLTQTPKLASWPRHANHRTWMPCHWESARHAETPAARRRHACGRRLAPMPAPSTPSARRASSSCGVNVGLGGFSMPDSKGVWRGLDVDACRAVAAAVFGDAEKVRYVPTTGTSRFAALQSGEIDILSRNTTFTFLRDVTIGLRMVMVNFYDGQGFLVRKDAKVGSLQGSRRRHHLHAARLHPRTEPRRLDEAAQYRVPHRPARHHRRADQDACCPTAATPHRPTAPTSPRSAAPACPTPTTSSSCPTASARSRSARWSAEPMTSGSTSCAGR